MGTSTPRLQLYKPAEAGEVIDVKTAINDNLDRIDRQAQTYVCTSTTRPAAPFDGMMIKETDTKAFGIWDAAAGRWYLWDNIWQGYTPTLTGIALGSPGQSLVAQYKRAGTGLQFAGRLLLGTGSSVSANVTIALPSGMGWSTPMNDANQTIGSMFVASSVPTGGFLTPASPNTFFLRRGSDGAVVGPSIPAAGWGVGHLMSWQGAAEAA